MDAQALRESGSAEPGWTTALDPVHFVHGRLISAVISEMPNPPPPVSPTTPGDRVRRLACILIAPHSPNEPPVEEDGGIYQQDILRMSLPVAVSAHSNFFLYDILPRAIPFVRKHLTAGRDVCVACPTGKDLGPGVIVTALSLFFDDDGDLSYGDDVEDKGEPAGGGLRRSLIECISRTSDRQTYDTKTAPMDHLEQPESKPLQKHPQTGKRIPHVPSPPPAPRTPTLRPSSQFLTSTVTLTLVAGL